MNTDGTRKPRPLPAPPTAPDLSAMEPGTAGALKWALQDAELFAHQCLRARDRAVHAVKRAAMLKEGAADVVCRVRGCARSLARAGSTPGVPAPVEHFASESVTGRLARAV